jgi:hypothetical protein
MEQPEKDGKDGEKNEKECFFFHQVIIAYFAPKQEETAFRRLFRLYGLSDLIGYSLYAAAAISSFTFFVIAFSISSNTFWFSLRKAFAVSRPDTEFHVAVRV